MDAETAAATAALFGIALPQDRAATISAELAALAARLRTIEKPAIEDEPSGFVRALNRGSGA